MLMVTTFKKRELPAATLREVQAITAGMPVNGEYALSSMLSPLPSASSVEREHQKFVPGQTFASNADGASSGAATGYQVGHVYDVALSTISSNPLNPRYVYTATAIHLMASSLSANGQRVSATGFIDENDAVVLIEGETRLRGARAAGLATLRVEIKKRPSTDQALYEEARAANVERKEQTPLDDALRWKELINKKVYPNQRALGLALGYSDEVVSRTVSIASMNSRIINVIAEYPDLLSLKMLVAVREYAELMGDDAALKLILDIAAKGLSARDVVAKRMAAQKVPTTRPTSNREPVSYKGATGEIKAFEKGGRVELSLKGLTPDAVTELTNALRTLLA
jgi:ParB family chromosome partitioning protein